MVKITIRWLIPAMCVCLFFFLSKVRGSEFDNVATFQVFYGYYLFIFMFSNIFLEIYMIFGFGCSWNCMLLRLNLLTHRAKFPFWWKYSKPCHCLLSIPKSVWGIFLWLQRTIARTMTDSSLHPYNDFVCKKMYFSYSCLCGKFQTHSRAAKE